MGTHTPPLTPQQKKDYIDFHLYSELLWLLTAATEWSVQEQLKLQKAGYNIQVYAMDSAFLHARVLFEFFVQRTTNHHYGVDQYLGPGASLTTAIYADNWSGPLHAFLIHGQDRSQPRQLPRAGGSKDLNRMPLEFAHEILRLWKEFESRLGGSAVATDQELGTLARGKRKMVVEAAGHVLTSVTARKHAYDKDLTLQPIFAF